MNDPEAVTILLQKTARTSNMVNFTDLNLFIGDLRVGKGIFLKL